MTERWIDRRELARITGLNPRSIDRQADAGKLTWRWNDKRSRNGKPEREFLSASQALAAKANERPQVHYSKKQLKEIAETSALLAPMIEAEREGKSVTAAARKLIRGGVIKGSTLWKYWGLYKKGGPDALVTKTRKDKGRSRSFENRPELRKFVIAKYIEAGADNFAFVKSAVQREWGGKLLPYSGKAPCYDALVSFIIETIPPAPLDAARLSQQQWAAKHAPYIPTGRGAYTRPLECWVADHRVYDVLVSNDCFPQAERFVAVRLWETAIQDMRSRVIVGSCWSVSPSWRTIATALRQGISLFGLPELFYCDNGKDFRKVGVGAQRGSLLATPNHASAPLELDQDGQFVRNDLLARLGIKVCYCTPRHPQSKSIESHFNYVSRRFDHLFFGRGYTGNKPALRPDFCRDAERQHKEFLAGKRAESPLLPASYFIRLHAQWLDESNYQREHTGRGMNGRAPMEVMDELLPAAQRHIPDMAAIAPLFWDVQSRQVANGKVQLNSASYSAALDDPEGQQNMHLANGGKVAVHCDPNDQAVALAFEDAPSGRFLARLASDELIAQRPTTGEEVAAICVQRNRLYRADREVLAAASAGVPSEIELLARRGHIERKATGTDGAQIGSRVSPRRIAAPEFPEEFMARFRGEK